MKKIADGTIDEQWMKALDEVEKRFKAVEMKAKARSKVKAVDDIKPLLENLINRVWRAFSRRVICFGLTIVGYREDTRFSCCSNKGFAIIKHQCSNSPTTGVYQAQGSLRLHSTA